jgi:hypothetical protein
MTATLSMTNLVKGLWTADEDKNYEGYAHATKTWNGWRVCYFADDVVNRIVEDIRSYNMDWYLTIEPIGDDEVVYEVTPDGEMVLWAVPVMVDGVRLWDTYGSGWTWEEAQDGCCMCGDIFPLTDLTDETREGYDPAKVYVCKDCLNDYSKEA